VLAFELPQGLLNLGDVSSSPLNSCGAVTFPLPAVDVVLDLVDAAPFLVHFVAYLTCALLISGAVDELQATRLARAVLPVALLPELTPAPITALPTCLIEVAHGFYFWGSL